jgi:hypothetical protein
MEQGTPSANNRRRRNLLHLMKPEVSLSCSQQELIPILSQFDPVHILISFILNTQFNISDPSTFISPRFSD